MPMKHLLAAALAIGLAASAYGATGDLTPKALDQPFSGGWMVQMNGQEFRPAPAGCGTVNPAAKIITLRGNTVTIMAAIDSAKADDKVLDILRVDVSGKGQFAGAPFVKIAWPAADGTGSAGLGPMTVMLPREGAAPLPALISGYITGSAGGVASVYMMVGACLEGPCAFGDKVHTVRLVDTTGNLKMDDPAKVEAKDGIARQLLPGDLIDVNIEDGQPKQSGYYGHPVLVDGKWYDVTVSADGAKVSAAPTKGPFGQIKIDADSWTAFLLGPDRVLQIKDAKGSVEVPAGRYVLLAADLKRGNTTASLRDNRMYGGKPETVEVVADKTLEDLVGAGLTASVKVTQNGRTVLFDPSLLDEGGRSIASLSSNSPAGDKLGRFEVTGADGKLVYSANLEFT
jgi:hypothetical protein